MRTKKKKREKKGKTYGLLRCRNSGGLCECRRLLHLNLLVVNGGLVLQARKNEDRDSEHDTRGWEGGLKRNFKEPAKRPGARKPYSSKRSKVDDLLACILLGRSWRP